MLPQPWVHSLLAQRWEDRAVICLSVCLPSYLIFPSPPSPPCLPSASCLRISALTSCQHPGLLPKYHQKVFQPDRGYKIRGRTVLFLRI